MTETVYAQFSTYAEANAAVGKTGRVPTTLLRAPIDAQTWRDAAYVLLGTFLGPVGIAYLYAGFGAGLLLTVVLVGIPLLAAVVVGSRIFGHIYRGLAMGLLRTDVEAPLEFRSRPGLLGFVRSGLTDRDGWRAVVFVLVKSVLGPVLGYLVLTFAAMSAFVAISPIPWWLFHPVNIDSAGVERHSIVQFGDVYFETWPQMLAFSALGFVCVFIAPWPIRAVASLDRHLVQALLGKTKGDARVEQLEHARTTVVEDSAATLRRVERDLHDGTQARLVTMAMALGRAEEKLATGGEATALVSDAHATAKEALRELREVVRGIHPPALDLGLGAALETLASRSPVPVDCTVHLATRPSPGIEAIAYFSVAELLTNVAKHANATKIWLDIRDVGTLLTITVRDNGIGGADPIGGTGLAGLRSRAETVDGHLDVTSPIGGPTVVTIALPTGWTS
ncbi:sensor domain-containing protein [Antrihabitans sp. YC3-6]|uniref:histidine kinase n=1 Tax=Antrihabitans stalagmiti TaxID=2799499 RepID=A0A934NUY0_9NOCA|nr:sensor domain-containing protein [Antrihabitans stalagmiti]MBJ8341630.1 sensor domain-containing protein [Antrihabitans stalagmiti]